MTHASIYTSLIENALILLEKLSESDVDRMMHDGRYPLIENWDLFLEMEKLEGGLHGWVVYLNREKNFTMRVIFRRYFASIEYKAELFQPSYYVKEIRILVSDKFIFFIEKLGKYMEKLLASA